MNRFFFLTLIFLFKLQICFSQEKTKELITRGGTIQIPISTHLMVDDTSGDYQTWKLAVGQDTLKITGWNHWYDCPCIVYFQYDRERAYYSSYYEEIVFRTLPDFKFPVDSTTSADYDSTYARMLRADLQDEEILRQRIATMQKQLDEQIVKRELVEHLHSKMNEYLTFYENHLDTLAECRASIIESRVFIVYGKNIDMPSRQYMHDHWSTGISISGTITQKINMDVLVEIMKSVKLIETDN